MPTLDEAMLAVEEQLAIARWQAEIEVARGKNRATATQPVIELLGRKHALQAMKDLPEAKVYYDAKVIGLELADGSFQSLRVGRQGLPIRTWQNLLVYRESTSGEVILAEPVELTSAGAQHKPGDAIPFVKHGRLVVVVTDPVDQAVSGLRVDPRVVAPARIVTYDTSPFSSPFTSLGEMPLSGSWRAYSQTFNGLIIEAHPDMEISIIQRPRAIDVTGAIAGEPIRVSDVRYSPLTLVLTFSYHTHYLFGGELTSHVTVTRTDPDLFEGNEIGDWAGATTRPFSLRMRRF